MKLVVLDRFKEENSVCLLCRTSIQEYVEALGDDFKDYYIQRGIVTNRYLDNLWDTIEKKRHIPAIVLVAGGPAPAAEAGSVYNFRKRRFKVLDGLQRSNRLKEAWDAVQLVNVVKDDPNISPIRLARHYAEQLSGLQINSALFQRVLRAKRQGVQLKSLFTDNNIWLEIWFNLDDDQQILKMLVLNAGHKSVNIKHQVELLFIGYLDILEDALGGAKIYREKDRSSLSYSKSRSRGEFHFSHLISAFVSLTAGKPITTNADFTASKSFDEAEDNDSLLGTDQELLEEFAAILALLDRTLSDALGVKWLGREVVLGGIFGAIGHYAQENAIRPHEALQALKGRVKKFAAVLNLEEFEDVRNSMDLSKVNLGSVNKLAVFRATGDFLNGLDSGPLRWTKYFGSQK